ncbi:MAG TPA: Mut7-C RNAse domain-containing protein [Candidatus Manganitrophaceae bacterium]|nr:Mut7-C RNAse domain-containing protein [Candidatus Manganitrophaceae bacterium]
MEPKLIVDTNVGHLARRLRMLGYDTLFINPIHDDRLFEVALKESRVIVSGDRGLFERRLIKSGRVKGFWVDVYEDHTDQLRRIIRAVGPSGALPFTRCIECNTPLLSKTREEAKEKVPPHVYETVAEYAYCPRCDQFFWEGDHVKRMREVIERL